MTRYAAALDDLDAIWATPSGAALVDAVLARPASEEPKLVTVEGADAIVLRGPSQRVAAVVAGLVDVRLPAPVARTVRVFANDGESWRPVRTPFAMAELPEEQPSVEAEAAEEGAAGVPKRQPNSRIVLSHPTRVGPTRASEAFSCRY